ncbi:unnamed protein product [Dibothriocephalus latus]|uniref:Uncharacterized protein n=1 Tax=Dibothriocephalus latus TaxID=60516 RepID=A0A3P7RRP0_DIBLA|nr:unnamed protein product [Dibothriocephalus latus]
MLRSKHIALFFYPFRSKDYETAAHHYQRGLLCAQRAFPVKTEEAKEKEPSFACGKETETEEAAFLHGNLSAVYFHRAKWVECAWSACLALQLHDDGASAASVTAPVIRRLVARLRQACSRSMMRKESRGGVSLQRRRCIMTFLGRSAFRNPDMAAILM